MYCIWFTLVARLAYIVIVINYVIFPYFSNGILFDNVETKNIIINKIGEWVMLDYV